MDVKPISIYEAMRVAKGEFSAKPQPTFFEQRFARWLAEQNVGADHKVFIRIAARQAFAAGWNAALDELGCNESETTGDSNG